MDEAEIAKEAKIIRNTFIFFGVAAFIAGCIIGLINIFNNNEIPGGIGVIVIGLVIALGLVGSTFQKDDALVLNSIKLELRRSLLKEKKERLEGKEVAFGTFSKSEIALHNASHRLRCVKALCASLDNAGYHDLGLVKRSKRHEYRVVALCSTDLRSSCFSADGNGKIRKFL